MSDIKGIFDPSTDAEKPADLDRPVQKPMAVRPADYVETGFLPVHESAAGGVVIGGGDPPEPALRLTGENLICLEDEGTGREECQFFVQFLSEAEGVTKGFGDQPKQIRCFCTKLATSSELMELGEVPIFACSARRPIDVPSLRIIRDFRNRQRDLAAEYAQEQSEQDL